MARILVMRHREFFSGAFMRLQSCAFLVLALVGRAADPQPPVQTFSAQAVRADFKELYERLRDSHYDLYARRPKAEYDRLYADLMKAFQKPMGLPRVEEAFQRFMAYGRVAHSRIDGGDGGYEAFRAGGGKALPLRIRVVEGRTFITANLSGNAQISAGDELVALEGRPMRKVLEALGQQVSADNAYMLHTLMEHQFSRLLWLAWGERKTFTATIRTSAGRRFTTQVLARSRPEAEAESQRQPKQLELDWNVREARVLPSGVAYLRPGPFYNVAEGATDPWDTADFIRFIDGAFATFQQAGATRLLIDLRDNPGGDNSFSDAMVAWFATRPFRFTSEFRIKASRAAIDSNAERLPQSPAGSVSFRMAAAYQTHPLGERFPFDLPTAQPREGARFAGKVFLLINRHSYSNTVTVAALAQDYGFARILGEETSDLATTYGAMEHFKLSRTGLSVGFPKAHIIRPNGDRRARGVVPDVVIPVPVVEPVEDPVLMRALEIARQ